MTEARDFHYQLIQLPRVRGVSRTAAESEMGRFVIIVNGFQPLTIITKRSILDVAAVLDPPLSTLEKVIAGNKFVKLSVDISRFSCSQIQFFSWYITNLSRIESCNAIWLCFSSFLVICILLQYHFPDSKLCFI